MKPMYILLLFIVVATRTSNADRRGGRGHSIYGTNNNRNSGGGALGGLTGALGGILGGLGGALGGQTQHNKHKEEEENVHNTQSTQNQNLWPYQQNQQTAPETNQWPYNTQNVNQNTGGQDDIEPPKVTQVSESQQQNNNQNYGQTYPNNQQSNKPYSGGQTNNPTANKLPTSYIDRDTINETPSVSVTPDVRYGEPNPKPAVVYVDPNDLQVKAVTPNPE